VAIVSAAPGVLPTDDRTSCFAPILTAFTARVAGISPADLLGSPAALARATLETQRLVGQGIVLCLHDPELLLRSCRASAGGRAETSALKAAGPDRVLATAPLAVVLEAVTQVRAGLPAGAQVLLTAAGPGMLFRQLRDAGAGDGGPELEAYVASVSVALANAAYAAHADGTALIEWFGDDVPSRVRRCHRTLRRVADFHGATLAAFASGGPADGGHFHYVFDFDGVNGDDVVVARGTADGPTWVCTRGDLPADAEVADLQAMAGEYERSGS
jgi:hypothetical protein